jgi:hypothetical protein
MILKDLVGADDLERVCENDPSLFPRGGIVAGVEHFASSWEAYLLTTGSVKFILLYVGFSYIRFS